MKRPDWRFRPYTADGTEDDFAGYCEVRVVEIALAKAPIWEVIKSFADMRILTSAYYWKLYFWVKF